MTYTMISFFAMTLDWFVFTEARKNGIILKLGDEIDDNEFDDNDSDDNGSDSNDSDEKW